MTMIICNSNDFVYFGTILWTDGYGEMTGMSYEITYTFFQKAGEIVC
ncbi:MAG: hypothetical protein PF505_02780 [Vallitaleaceae bacterium]|jgi:uncharacterized membrane protein YphA (DoxX/SURF4 family)|nr:hypothetical protein [Vallitaleaceae bacterium]